MIVELREAEYIYHLAIAKVGMVELQTLQNKLTKELRILFRTLGYQVIKTLNEDFIKKLSSQKVVKPLKEADSGIGVSFNQTDLKDLQAVWDAMKKANPAMEDTKENLAKLLNDYATKAYNLGGNTALAFFGVTPSFKLRDEGILDSIKARAENSADGTVNSILNKAKNTIIKEYQENGKNPKEIAKVIQSDFDNTITKSRAALIAHQETLIPTMDARLTSFQRSGIKQKRWIAHNFVSPLDPRPTHKAANDQIVNAGEPFSVGYESLMYPGDPMASARETMRCHCVMLPVISDKFEPSDAWKGESEEFMDSLEDDDEDEEDNTTPKTKKEEKEDEKSSEEEGINKDLENNDSEEDETEEEPEDEVFDKNKYKDFDWANYDETDIQSIMDNSKEFSSDELGASEYKLKNEIKSTSDLLDSYRETVNIGNATTKYDLKNKLESFKDTINGHRVSQVQKELSNNPNVTIRKLMDSGVKSGDDFADYFLLKYSLKVPETITSRQAKDLDTALNNKVVNLMRGLAPTEIILDLTGDVHSADSISSKLGKDDTSNVVEKYLKLVLRDTSKSYLMGETLSAKIGLKDALSESKRNFQFNNSVMSDTLGKVINIFAESKDFSSAFERIKTLDWSNGNVDSLIEPMKELAKLFGMKVPEVKVKKVKPKSAKSIDSSYNDIFNNTVEKALEKAKETYINVDGASIEHQVVTIQNRAFTVSGIDSGGKVEGYRVSFKIRDLGTEAFKDFMEKSADGYVLPVRGGKGTYNYAANATYNSIEGKTWVSADKDVVVQHCSAKDKWSLNNSVEILVKADSYDSFVSKFRQTMADVNLENYVHVPLEADEDALKMAKLNYMFAPKEAWQAKTNEDHRRIFKTLTADEQGVLKSLEKKEVSPGYFTYVDKSKYLKNYAESQGVKYLRHNLSDSSPENLLLYVQNGGLLATTERFKNGIKSTGMSSWRDIETGGAESVFTRIVYGKGSRNNNVQKGSVKISTKIFERTDMYAYADDCYGATNPNDSNGRAFRDRDKVTQVVDKTIENDNRTNEFMFKKSVPVEYWDGFGAGSRQQEYIDYFKSKGVNSVNGIPVEKFFTT